MSKRDDEGGHLREKERVKYKRRSRWLTAMSPDIPPSETSAVSLWANTSTEQHHLDASGIYSHSPWLCRETRWSPQCQSQICNHLLIAQQWLVSQVRSQLSGLQTLLCLPTGESRPWDFDMRCFFSFQGCGDSAMQLLAISCHWRAVCIITLRYVINYDWVYEGLATRQHKMYIVCYVLDSCVST